jgi:hypothetical protein
MAAASTKLAACRSPAISTPFADAQGAQPARFSPRQIDDDTVYRASEYVIGVRYVFRRRPSDKPSEAPKPPTFDKR